MGNRACPIKIYKFGGDPLNTLSTIRQARYLQCYLEDLGAQCVIEEQNYFDKDYLSEFASFYCTSSRGYPNTCRRLHFFSDKITRDTLRRAACGTKRSIFKMQNSYLGFMVVRPIPAAPLGRTVVKWYPENFPETPRVTNPQRLYITNFLGIKLSVTGLAWQQQDTGVSACATIGLWTMLHSSAFDDHHAIPTTADITKSAHLTASLGARVFPSSGLKVEQVCEAIKAQNLSPVLLSGDLDKGLFTKERFSSTCSAFLRSGYPVILIGYLGEVGLHAICAVGFRSSASPNIPDRTIIFEDSNNKYLYVHDDNLGPNVRFEIKVCPESNATYLSPSAPPPRIERDNTCPTSDYLDFFPINILVAVHHDLRTDPDTLHKAALTRANIINQIFDVYRDAQQLRLGLTISSRFIKLAEYIGDELKRTINNSPVLLGQVRINLSEKVVPMSLHIGVVRIGIGSSTPLVDVIFDTTDSDKNHPVFCSVAYAQVASLIVKHFPKEFGTIVEAY